MLDLAEDGLRSRLILQVHDEVLLEVPPDEEEAATKVTLEAMQGAALLSVHWKSTCPGARAGRTQRARAGGKDKRRVGRQGALGTDMPGKDGRKLEK